MAKKGRVAEGAKAKAGSTSDSRLWEAIGPVALSAIQGWVSSLEARLPRSGQATLSEISKLAFETRNEVLAPIVEAIVRHQVEAWQDTKYTDCPHCGRPVFRKRTGERQLLTLAGTLVVPTPYFYCAACGEGFSPVSDALELAEAMRQYDVQAVVTKLAAKMSYEEAVEIAGLIVGEKIVASTTHDHVQAVVAATQLATVIPTAEELKIRLAAAGQKLGREPLVVVAADGAMAPTRPEGGRKTQRGPGKWREVKGFRVLAETDGGGVQTLASWHQIGDTESLRAALLLVAERLPETGFEVVLVGDGAEWVWNVMTACFPKAVQILDKYHLAEHVFDCAHAQYGETVAAEQWALVMLARLSQNHVSDALGGLRRMLPSGKEAKKEIERLISYLETHRERLDYDRHRAEGRPIGSGAIEAANKAIVHRRLKISGAWWLEANGNGLLRLRCALANGTFDRVMRAYINSRTGKSTKATLKS